MNVAVSFEGVVKRYGSLAALNGLDFSIRSGELYGLIGPNGAGKSTAIKIMVGLAKPSAGQATVLGQLPGSAAARRLIGYMPQETALYIDLTVRENLDLFGRLYGLRRAERAERITELLQLVDLSDRAHTVVADLSGGMRHRTSLAAALVARPRLVVLDEPTVGVDPELRANFWHHFAQLQREGTTILITTHYMDEALRCDRVGLINHGRLVADGTPRELMHRTGTRHLEAAFLAYANREPQEVVS